MTDVQASKPGAIVFTDALLGEFRDLIADIRTALNVAPNFNIPSHKNRDTSYKLAAALTSAWLPGGIGHAVEDGASAGLVDAGLFRAFSDDHLARAKTALDLHPNYNVVARNGSTTSYAIAARLSRFLAKIPLYEAMAGMPAPRAVLSNLFMVSTPDGVPLFGVGRSDEGRIEPTGRIASVSVQPGSVGDRVVIATIRPSLGLVSALALRTMAPSTCEIPDDYRWTVADHAVRLYRLGMLRRTEAEGVVKAYAPMGVSLQDILHMTTQPHHHGRHQGPEV